MDEVDEQVVGPDLVLSTQTDGGPEVDSGPLSPSYVDFALNHVLITGQ